MSNPVIIGIIGGSGLDDPDIMEDRQEKDVTTPFGKPSDSLILGKISGVNCILIARYAASCYYVALSHMVSPPGSKYMDGHGRKHTINPTNINYRANIWALKQEGCCCIIVSSAVGSLQEEILPGDIVVLDQFIDRTTKRFQTFYDGEKRDVCQGICHIPVAKPFSNDLRKILISSIEELEVKNFHPDGTIVVIEGPRFSTMAESKVWQSYKASVVGMTMVPEVVLANEAAIPYASLALVTDIDSWHDDEGTHVSVDMVMKQMVSNAAICKKIMCKAIPKIAAYNWEPVLKQYQDSLNNSLML